MFRKRPPILDLSDKPDFLVRKGDPEGLSRVTVKTMPAEADCIQYYLSRPPLYLTILMLTW